MQLLAVLLSPPQASLPKHLSDNGRRHGSGLSNADESPKAPNPRSPRVLQAGRPVFSTPTHPVSTIFYGLSTAAAAAAATDMINSL